MHGFDSLDLVRVALFFVGAARSDKLKRGDGRRAAECALKVEGGGLTRRCRNRGSGSDVTALRPLLCGNAHNFVTEANDIFVL